LKRRAAGYVPEREEDRDIHPFRNEDGTPRLATPEENLAIATGRIHWATGRKIL
jgi:hypothetical protein